MDPLVKALIKIACLNGSSASDDIQDAQGIAREALETLGIDVDDLPDELREQGDAK